MKIYYTGEFAGGRTESRRLLKRAIAEHTGDERLAAELVSAIKTEKHGKPYIEGFDHFSVSHTGSFWAVLICGRECGLDIQLGKKCDMAAISRRIYAPEDAGWIARVSEEYPSKAQDEFFRVWTRREALAKAAGGTVYDTGLPSVLTDDPLIDARPYRLSDISFPDEAAPEGARLYAAVCVEDDGNDPAGSVSFCPLKQNAQ